MNAYGEKESMMDDPTSSRFPASEVQPLRPFDVVVCRITMATAC